MATTAKPKRRLFIAKNLIMMLVMAVTIVLAVSSWFTSRSTATANGISVKSRQGGIDIAPCIKTYDASGNVLTDGPGEFGGDVTFTDFSLTKDCTGDGVSLIVPEFNVAKDFVSVKQTGKEVNNDLGAANATPYNVVYYETVQTPEENIPEYQYIQLEFYVRSKEKTLSLSPDSYLISPTEDNGSSAEHPLCDADYYNSVGKKSAYGDFSADGLVGAMRVSLIAQAVQTVTQQWTKVDGVTTLTKTGRYAPNATFFTGTSPEKQILWVARPDIYLEVSSGNAIDNWILHDDVASGSTDGAHSYQNQYYRTINNNTAVELVTDNDSKTKYSSNDVGTYYTLGQTVNVSDFTYSEDVTMVPNILPYSYSATTEPYYVTKFTMNIWIEGTDAEARRAMDGGEFEIHLFFV